MGILGQLKDGTTEKKRSSLFYILIIAILVLATIATIRLSSTFRKGIELDIRDEYVQQISELETKLEKQQKSYEENLSKVSDDHAKEIEKKDKLSKEKADRFQNMLKGFATGMKK